MSRVGRANFKIAEGNPNSHDAVWREGLNREQWDHTYHSLRLDDPKRRNRDNLRKAKTETTEAMGKTWHIMSHVYSSAAGKSSYHFNQQKPVGNVKSWFPSASFSYLPRVFEIDPYKGSLHKAITGKQPGKTHTDHLWPSAPNTTHGKLHLTNSRANSVRGAGGNSGSVAGQMSGRRRARSNGYESIQAQRGMDMNATYVPTLRADESAINDYYMMPQQSMPMMAAPPSERNNKFNADMMSKTFSEGFGMSPSKATKHESVMPMSYEKNIMSQTAGPGGFGLGEQSSGPGFDRFAERISSNRPNRDVMRHTVGGPFFRAPQYPVDEVVNFGGPNMTHNSRTRTKPISYYVSPAYRTMDRDQMQHTGEKAQRVTTKVPRLTRGGKGSGIRLSADY